MYKQGGTYYVMVTTSCLEKKDEIDIHIPSEIESKKRSILEKRKLLKIEIVGGYDKLKKRIS
ncbi:hypothetical protein N9Y26_01050 [bacterium]|nr:hypothetical protein [bacterium]